MRVVGASSLAVRRLECSRADPAPARSSARLWRLERWAVGSRRGAGAVAGPRVVPKDPEVRQTLAQIAYAVRRKIFEGSS
jgi:hypothetical protein